MKRLTRREFLKLSALGSGGVLLEQLLTSCGVPAASPSPAPPAEGDATPAGGPSATAFQPGADTPAATPTDPAPKPDLVVVRGGGPEAMLRRAFESLGGMGAFVPAGARVVIKPNICNAYHTYEYASTTNPWVVGGLVRLCLEAGAAGVSVFDFPFGGSAQDAYQTSGIREQVEAAGGVMVVMSNLKFVPVGIPGALVLGETHAYQDALDADVLINVPIAKQHGSTRLTLGMKNLMGLVQNRNTLHTIGLHKSIADLASLFRPELTVMDAVRILTANGPTGGDLADVRRLDTVIVSPDIVAVDAYTTRLFGMNPEDIDYIRRGAELGLGRLDLENLRIEEIEA